MNPTLEYCEDPYEAVRHSDALLILTDWPCFRELDYGRIKMQMASPCIVDGRNLLDAGALRDLGFAYDGVGRSQSGLRDSLPSDRMQQVYVEAGVAE